MIPYSVIIALPGNIPVILWLFPLVSSRCCIAFVPPNPDDIVPPKSADLFFKWSTYVGGTYDHSEQYTLTHFSRSKLFIFESLSNATNLITRMGKWPMSFKTHTLLQLALFFLVVFSTCFRTPLGTSPNLTFSYKIASSYEVLGSSIILLFTHSRFFEYIVVSSIPYPM